jgi:hypothetical protein
LLIIISPLFIVFSNLIHIQIEKNKFGKSQTMNHSHRIFNNMNILPGLDEENGNHQNEEEQQQQQQNEPEHQQQQQQNEQQQQQQNGQPNQIGNESYTNNHV